MSKNSLDEQPRPSGGKQEVIPLARKFFEFFSRRQEMVGIRKYGQPLMTWDGRDTWRDVWEEYADLGHYLAKCKQQYDDIVKENNSLKKDNERLTHENDSIKGNIRKLTTEHKTYKERLGIVLGFLKELCDEADRVDHLDESMGPSASISIEQQDAWYKFTNVAKSVAIRASEWLHLADEQK
jgi:predicted nuclease with TOPRIM domain